MTYGRTISVFTLMAAFGLALPSACGSTKPETIPDNNTTTTGAAGAAGTGELDASATTAAGTGGAGSATGGAGSAAGGSAGSGGSATVDMDATVFVDAPVANADGSFVTIDASLDDDSGPDPVPEAGVAADGAVERGYSIRCGLAADPNKLLLCNGPSRKCCYDSDTPRGYCPETSTACNTASGTFLCDGPEDCEGKAVCCAKVYTGATVKGTTNEYSSYCSTSCGTGFVQRDYSYAAVCKTNTDCNVGYSCKAVANMPDKVGVCIKNAVAL
ncbi:MAG TPA: hypothetical protein VJT73_11960 [Polyangiaceae bacterium]|nr:hypothetical protein [Polyangiaceae bacterium]